MGSDDDTIIIGGKIKRALNYYVTGIKLWHLLAGAVVFIAIGAKVF